MAVLPKCPSCGMESPEWRCPRCNTLKVVGCAGSCTVCGTKTTCDVPGTDRPEDAPAEKPGSSASCCG